MCCWLAPQLCAKFIAHKTHGLHGCLTHLHPAPRGAPKPRGAGCQVTAHLHATIEWMCWLPCGAGYNGDGQLGTGDNTGTDQYSPVAVQGAFIFTQLTAGDGHTCGLLGNGTAMCWGELLEACAAGLIRCSVPSSLPTRHMASMGASQTCILQPEVHPSHVARAVMWLHTCMPL